MTGPVEHAQRAVAQLQLLAVVQRPRDLDGRAPGAKARGDGPQRGDDVGGDAVQEHHPLGEAVVELGRLAVVAQVGSERRERRDLGAGAPREDRGQAEVVDVLVGDHQQLDVLDRVSARGERLFELVQRLARVRPRVDERERRVLDQVGVDAPDHERRGNRQAMDALLGGARGSRSDLPAVASGSSSPIASPRIAPAWQRRDLLAVRQSRADQVEHLVAAAFHVLRGRRATPGTGAAAARCSRSAR